MLLPVDVKNVILNQASFNNLQQLELQSTTATALQRKNMFKFLYALCALMFLTNANAGDQTIEADKVQLRADKAKLESDKAAAKAAKKSANSGAAPTAALAADRAAIEADKAKLLRDKELKHANHGKKDKLPQQ